MDLVWLLPLLAMFTLLSVVVFALLSKKRVEERRHDPNSPKSSLAPDSAGAGAVEKLQRKPR
ncbi:hypothetical protein [Pararhodobacter sp. SW119]|uniref:hypothetical protein n=1 Tax=Pararhodobacter sp. SW119 TaxID=2780075 RepID=UPI001AE08BCE|nr:hypothetical protein [Pararhodobacter sp. SW119]